MSHDDLLPMTVKSKWAKVAKENYYNTHNFIKRLSFRT